MSRSSAGESESIAPVSATARPHRQGLLGLPVRVSVKTASDPSAIDPDSDAIVTTGKSSAPGSSLLIWPRASTTDRDSPSPPRVIMRAAPVGLGDTVFAQVLKLVPRHEFESLARKHKSGTDGP